MTEEILDIIKESVCSTGERIGERARGKRTAVYTHDNEGDIDIRLQAITEGFFGKDFVVDSKNKVSEYEYEIKIRKGKTGVKWTIFLFERRGFIMIKVD